MLSCIQAVLWIQCVLLCSCLGHSALVGINVLGHQLIIWTKTKTNRLHLAMLEKPSIILGWPHLDKAVHKACVSVTAQQDVGDQPMHLPCRPDLFALPLSRVSGIQAQAYHLLGWSEPWAPSAIGNSSFMFAESGQFLLNR